MILFPVLFILATSIMSYHAGVLDTKNQAVEQESFCIDLEEEQACYSVFPEVLWVNPRTVINE